MVTARNWLADQGLAKRDGRGRFATPAKDALAKALSEGMTFDDWNSDGRVIKQATGAKRGRKPKLVARVQKDGSIAMQPKSKTSQRLAPIVKTAEQLRDGFTFWGLERGLAIAFQHCSGCNKSTALCQHEIPLLPSWLGGGPGLLKDPR